MVRWARFTTSRDGLRSCKRDTKTKHHQGLWPLFRSLRDRKDFIQAWRMIFRHPLIPYLPARLSFGYLPHTTLPLCKKSLYPHQRGNIHIPLRTSTYLSPQLIQPNSTHTQTHTNTLKATMCNHTTTSFGAIARHPTTPTCGQCFGYLGWNTAVGTWFCARCRLYYTFPHHRWVKIAR
jgi:hypothetical protein